MGCDIHIWAEKRRPGSKTFQRVTEDVFTLDDFDKEVHGKQKCSIPFDWRQYGMFGFFAGIRNYSHVIPLADPRGLPEDSDYLNEPTEDGYDYNPMSG